MTGYSMKQLAIIIHVISNWLQLIRVYHFIASSNRQRALSGLDFFTLNSYKVHTFTYKVNSWPNKLQVLGDK